MRKNVFLMLSSSPPAQMVGQTFSHFRVVELLGEGGMGVVYKADDLRLGRQVAIKFLPETSSSDRQALDRLQREARAASALNHPNICTIHDVDEFDGRPFIVMELLEGHTLREYIRRKHPDLDTVVKLAAQIADALAAAHAKGIIHRDIKSANIFVTSAGQVKVLDFGLAKVVESVGSGETATVTSGAQDEAARALLTSPGQMLGTVAYMSPEQVRGEELDTRTDIFSFGVVLYETVTGALPFTGSTSGLMFDAILNRTPTPVHERAPGVPASLALILEKALEKNRELRYQSVRDLRADLARLARDTGSGSAVTRRPVTSGDGRPSSRRRLWLATAVAAIVAAIGLTTYVLMNPAAPATSGGTSPADLTRLTFDAGLQTQPTWSPDGRFIAYASNQSGNLDIWVQPVSGGRAIQVTNDPATDWEPDWSPDGNQLAFRSERDGGGIYIAPAFGGRERRLTTFGSLPQWTPSGTELLIQVIPPVSQASAIPAVYLVGLDGSPPRRVLEEALAPFGTVHQLSMHPDGKRVSFDAHGAQREGLWTAPLSGGQAVIAPLADDVARTLTKGGFGHPTFRWAPSGDAMYLSVAVSGTVNLWRVEVDPQTLRWTAGPERMTTGAGRDGSMAASPDGRTLAFVTSTATTRLWSLPLDARTGRVTGEGQALTGAEVSVSSFDLATDGRWLVYAVLRTGRTTTELRVRSLVDGSEKLAADGLVFAPRISRDGSRVAYRIARQLDPPINRLLWQPISGGEAHEMDVGISNADNWSPDAERLLHNCPNVWPRALCISPRDSRSVADAQQVVSDPNHALWQGRFSPDGRFVLFNAQDMKTPSVSVLGVVPAAGGVWTRLTSEKLWADKARWSADGRTIYFMSNRHGAFFDVWGIRFDPATGRSVGEEFRVTRYEDPVRLLESGAGAELGVDESRIIAPVTELSGSIWLLKRGTK